MHEPVHKLHFAVELRRHVPQSLAADTLLLVDRLTINCCLLIVIIYLYLIRRFIYNM